MANEKTSRKYIIVVLFHLAASNQFKSPLVATSQWTSPLKTKESSGSSLVPSSNCRRATKRLLCKPTKLIDTLTSSPTNFLILYQRTPRKWLRPSILRRLNPWLVKILRELVRSRTLKGWSSWRTRNSLLKYAGIFLLHSKIHTTFMFPKVRSLTKSSLPPTAETAQSSQWWHLSTNKATACGAHLKSNPIWWTLWKQISRILRR